MGSSIKGKIFRDNEGKVLLPAGTTTTSKDQSYKVLPKLIGGFRIDG
jgi:hypothetical protein